jgi:hypothetical protein
MSFLLEGCGHHPFSQSGKMDARPTRLRGKDALQLKKKCFKTKKKKCFKKKIALQLMFNMYLHAQPPYHQQQQRQQASAVLFLFYVLPLEGTFTHVNNRHCTQFDKRHSIIHPIILEHNQFRN